MNQVAADLTKALAILEKDGWIKGELECKDGKHCAEGAVNVAVYNKAYTLPGNERDQRSSRRDAAIEALETAMPPHIRRNIWHSITHYNDQRGVNFQHVQAWFRRAIRNAEKES